MNAILDELRDAPPFDVVGLVSPQLEPLSLAESGRGGNGWNLISLHYGESLSSTGPAVCVRTAVQRQDGHVEPDLSELIADERNRLFDHAGIDEPDPIDDPIDDLRTLEIDGGRVDARLLLDGELWAARVEFPPGVGVENGRRVVSVVSRGVAPSDVRLAFVRDLNPYLDGRDRFIKSMIERGAGSAPGGGSVPEGEAALRGIIEYCIRESEEHEERRGVGRRRSPRQSPDHRYELWRAAVRFQASAWDQGEHQANEQVTSVVNHLGRLSREAPWFAVREDVRSAAIDEAIAYVARGEAVASADAQRAWNELWRVEHGAAAPNPFRQDAASND